MAKDVPSAEETKSLLAVAKKRALSFGLCLGKKPDTTVLVLHRNKPPETLMRMAKKAGETPKTTCGNIEIKGKKVKLDCHADVPPGLAKSLRRYLQTLGMKGMSVTVLDAAGGVLDEELDEEEQAAAEAQSDETVEEQAETAETASDEALIAEVEQEEETPVAKEAEKTEEEQEPAPATTGEASAAEGAEEAQDQQKADSVQLARQARDLKQTADAIGGPAAEKLIKALGAAAKFIRASENQRAETMLGKIDLALKKLADSQAQPGATNGADEAAPADEKAPEVAPEVRASRLSSLASLEKNVDKLISEFA